MDVSKTGFMDIFTRAVAGIWEMIWAYVVPLFLVAIVVFFTYKVLRIAMGKKALPGQGIWVFVKRSFFGALFIPLAFLCIVTFVHFFGYKIDVSQYHEAWKGQLHEMYDKVIVGVFVGETDPADTTSWVDDAVDFVSTTAGNLFAQVPDSSQSKTEIYGPQLPAEEQGKVGNPEVKTKKPDPEPASSGGISNTVVWQYLSSAVKYLVFTLFVVGAIFAIRKMNQFQKSTEGQLKIEKFIKAWPYIYNLIFGAIVIFEFWPFAWPFGETPSEFSLGKAVMMFVAVLLGNLWFYYVARRKFENQKTKTEQQHTYSILGCALMSLGLLFVPLLAFGGLALLIAVGVSLLLAWKVAKLLFSSFSGEGKVGEFFSWFSHQPLKSKQFGLTAFALLIALAAFVFLLYKVFGILMPALSWAGGVLFQMGSLYAILWIVYMVASYIFSSVQVIQPREIYLPIFAGEPINWPGSVIFRNTHRWEFTDEYREAAEAERGKYQQDDDKKDGYGTAGLYISWVSPAMPWFSYVVLPFEKKEQVYRTTFTQGVLNSGKAGAGGGIQDIIRIVVLTCFEPKTYWGLGDDERRIISKDEIIDEDTGDKGNLGVALRVIKVRRRRQLQEMDLDEALASKDLFRNAAADKEVEASEGDNEKVRADIFKDIQTEVRFDSGAYLETIEITDINVESGTRQELENLYVAQKQRVRADIDAETTVIKNRAKGKGATAEMEEIEKGLTANPEGAKYALEVTKAKSISLSSILDILKKAVS